MIDMKKNNQTPWILAACFGALFVILLVLLLTVDVAPIAPLGDPVGLSTINQAVKDAIGGVNYTLYDLAELTGYLALLTAAFFAILGLIQLVKRRSLAKVDRELIVLACLYVVSLLFYIFFEVFVVNVRPVMVYDSSTPEASFPSSHTLLAITFFGSAVLLCRKYLQKKPLRVCAQIALCVLLVFTTVCRFLSGAHWLTDILGGILLGASLLCLFHGALNQWGRKEE